MKEQVLHRLFLSLTTILSCACQILLSPTNAFAQSNEKPNIVFILMDNYGWGEPGVYGGGVLRGAPSPNIDGLAAEGMQLLNFNVESQCTPSRAAFLTGRYAIRTGNGAVPVSNPEYGLTQWEYTLAESLSDAGYATGIFGKWHLGQTDGRFPTDQGFDEWWGIPNSSDESTWGDDTRFVPDTHPAAHLAEILESKRGEAPTKVKLYDTEARTLIDGEITEKSIDYMERKVAEKKPFFLYIPYTQPHVPALPDPEFRGSTGAGDFADVLHQTDVYVGRLKDAVERLGIADNTIFVFTSDNGPDPTFPHSSFAGPWEGSYYTGKEGSLRVPFIVRWPGHIPAGSKSNEIVHQMDLYPTIAKIVGAKVPKDRVIDGVDQTAFFSGEQKKSNREHVMIYVGNDLYGIKWRDFKIVGKSITDGFKDPVSTFSVPQIYDLRTDPKEENSYASNWFSMSWIRWPAGVYLEEHIKSLKVEPPISPGAPDPYVPGAK
ncbi:MAG: arylsulfatase [Bacteroidales bacterium]